MDCAEKCGPGASVALPLEKLPRGEWKRVGIPLKCIAAAGTDLSVISEPLTLATTGTRSFALAEAALGALDQAETLVASKN
jgi:beta-glucosidase